MDNSNAALMEGLTALSQARNLETIFRCVERYPALLSVEAVDNLIEQVKLQPRRDVQEHLNYLCYIIFRCVEDGIDNARADALAPYRPDLQSLSDALSTGQAVHFEDAEAHRFARSFSELSEGTAYFYAQDGDSVENIERAIEHLERALNTFQAAGGPDHSLIFIIASQMLGKSMRRRIRGRRAENMQRSLYHLKRASVNHRRGRNPVLWACIRSDLGLTHGSMPTDRAQHIEHAIQCYRDALSVLTPGRHRSLWGTACNNLGLAYNDRLDGDAAENQEKAISAFRDALTVRSPMSDVNEWTGALNNLGIAYQDRIKGDTSDNIERSILCFKVALIFAHSQGPDWFGRTFSNAARAYEARLRGDRASNLETAIQLREKSVKIFKGRDPYACALAMSSLVTTYTSRLVGEKSDNLRKAIEYGEEALSVLDPLEYAYDRAIACNNLALAYQDRRGGDTQDVRRMISLLEEALAASQTFTQSTGFAVNLALALVQTRNEDDAMRALSILETTVSAVDERLPKAWAMAKRTIAMLHATSASGVRAENLATALKAIREAKVPGRSDVEVVQDYCTEASILILMGPPRWKDARTALVKAMDVPNTALPVTYESRIELLRAASEVGPLLAFIALEEGQLSQAFEFLEGNRTYDLRSILATTQSILSLPENQRAYALKAQREVLDLRARLGRIDPLLPNGQYAALAIRLRDSESKLRDLVKHAATLAPVRLSALLGAIPEDTILVAPAATMVGGFVFVIPAGTTRIEPGHVVRLPDLKSDRLRTHTFNFWASIRLLPDVIDEPASVNKAPRTAQLEGDIRASLSWVGKELVQPIVELLSEMRVKKGGTSPTILSIVSSGDFACLPIHAAPLGEDPGGEVLWDAFAVSYTPSVYALTAARDRAVSGHIRDRLLCAVINPTQDLHFTEQLDLPTIRRCFADGTSRILIGPDASAVALKNSAAGCTHLHLSCHSRFDWSAPQKSGFVLANGEVFTLSQISADLSLDKCELVFAAGCETGNSDPSNAPQEAIGQVSSFLQAGAAGVVATLWPLYDDAAALLTAKFYELHIGKSMTAAYALREAALSMRRLRPAEYRSMMARHFGASDSRSMRGFLLMEKLRNEVGSGEKHAPGFEEEEVPFDHPLIWAPFTAWGRHIRADDRLQTK